MGGEVTKKKGTKAEKKNEKKKKEGEEEDGEEEGEGEETDRKRIYVFGGREKKTFLFKRLPFFFTVCFYLWKKGILFLCFYSLEFITDTGNSAGHCLSFHSVVFNFSALNLAVKKLILRYFSMSSHVFHRKLFGNPLGHSIHLNWAWLHKKNALFIPREEVFQRNRFRAIEHT